MRSYLHNDGRGAQLGEDDRAAISYLYGDGPRYTPTPSPQPTLVSDRSDINEDGEVSALDLLILLSDWKKVSGP